MTRPYRAVCISMYVDDVAALDAKVEALRDLGWTHVTRSSLIRVALHAIKPEQVEPPPSFIPDSPRVESSAVSAETMAASAPAPTKRRVQYASRDEEAPRREVTCACGTVFYSRSRTVLPKVCPACKTAAASGAVP